MAIRKLLLVTLVLAATALLCTDAVQATRYGRNGTVNAARSVNDCSLLPFSCSSWCDETLAAKCQQAAPGYCNNGDFFISATYGGTYSPISCSITNTKPSPLCILETQFHRLGSVSCSGSCNALCEVNESCECVAPFDCLLKYGDPGLGTWECLFCQCLLTNSPLVLHLPDYLSGGPADRGPGGSQNWWKKGFCGADTPTVCLDWAGDGRQTCTAWFEPGSENAFIVNLSDEDMLDLLEWSSIRAEPWRHLFGNVTQGPSGDRPYEHGFAALAEYCGQSPDADSRIDLTQCGETLFVWSDRNVDGTIDIEEILEFRDLGITALSDVRKTGKTDKCGNILPVESSAICANGKCGTVLDIFFRLRK